MNKTIPQTKIDFDLPRATPFGRRLWLAGGLLVVLSWVGLALLGEGRLFNPDGWTILRRFFEGLLQPDFSPAFLKLTINAAFITFYFALLATLFSVLIGFWGGILASERWWQAHAFKQSNRSFSWQWKAIRTGLSAPRALHELVWGLLLVNLIGLDPWVAILGIAIPNSAYIAKVFAETLDETPDAAFKALLNAGASPAKAFLYGLLPPAGNALLSYAFYRFECALRSSAVLGIIGAGGLGYQIFLSLQTLKYDQIWTLLMALLLLNGLIDGWSGALRRRLDEPTASRLAKPVSRRYRRWYHDPLWRSILALGLITPIAFWQLDLNLGSIVSSNTVEQMAFIIRSGFPPEFDGLTLSAWVRNTGVTAAMSILALAIAGILSFPFAFAAARFQDLAPRNHWRYRILGRGFQGAIRFALLLLRSVPAPIWALLALFVVFPGILPGAIALALYTTGVLGRLMAEVLETMDLRSYYALRHAGAAGPQAHLYGSLPTASNRFLSLILVRWEELIRSTVVVGLVGAGGLGLVLTQQLSSLDYAGVHATLWVFVLMTILVDRASIRIRRRLRNPI